MEIAVLRDKKIIESKFRGNTDLNVYQIGDLDDFFYKYTVWYGLVEDNNVRQIALLYTGMQLPTLLGICDRDFEAMNKLLMEIKPQLPSSVYAHLSPGMIRAFEDTHKIKSFGMHYKMALKKINFQDTGSGSNIRKLNPDDYVSLQHLYQLSYPDNWFDKRMLETGKYYGFFTDEKISGAAGIHVYSTTYRVAALGNIVTDPVQRGRSICKSLTAFLCRDLLNTVDNIGLNVHTENTNAIRCYEKIGFDIIGEYEEVLLEKY